MRFFPRVAAKGTIGRLDLNNRTLDLLLDELVRLPELIAFAQLEQFFQRDVVLPRAPWPETD